MRAPARTFSRRAAALGALLICLSGCGFLHGSRSAHSGTLTLPAARPAVLIVITNPDSPAAMRETGALIAATARTGEKVIILGDDAGATLAASTAPPPPAVRAPVAPSPLGPDPTSFQRARYATALSEYRAAVLRDRATLGELQQAELTAWATRVLDGVNTQLTAQRDQGPDIAASLGAAAADLWSLRQTGYGDDTGAVIAIVGIDETAQSVPVPPAGLLGSTVVVSDFPPSGGGEAAWRASLMQAGASKVVLLTGAAGDLLAPAVGQALNGPLTAPLISVLFGLGQYRLTAAALPQLRRLLRLLTSQYPDATATIIGYTDDLPTPGGNLRLSQLRAQAVANWLTDHGVASYRLQVYGEGATDPVAPNTPNGQPLDRRVVIIIDPAVS